MQHDVTVNTAQGQRRCAYLLQNMNTITTLTHRCKCILLKHPGCRMLLSDFHRAYIILLFSLLAVLIEFVVERDKMNGRGRRALSRNDHDLRFRSSLQGRNSAVLYPVPAADWGRVFRRTNLEYECMSATRKHRHGIIPDGALDAKEFEIKTQTAV